MAYKVCYSLFLLLVLLEGFSNGWRAVPANEAMYAERSADAGRRNDAGGVFHSDNFLPRNSLHSVYKFGYCVSEAINPVWLKASLNITLDVEDVQAESIYALTDVTVQRWRLQCVVMRIWTPAKYLFYRGRIPMYYCQGQIITLMMMTCQRVTVHEFYIGKRFYLPSFIHLMFYHPPHL